MFSTGRDAHEVARVGSLHPQANGHVFAFPDQLLNGVAHVRERGVDHRFEPVEPLQIHGRRPGEVSGEAGGAQLHRCPATVCFFEESSSKGFVLFGHVNLLRFNFEGFCFGAQAAAAKIRPTLASEKNSAGEVTPAATRANASMDS
jgi:hypothetical protein